MSRADDQLAGIPAWVDEEAVLRALAQDEAELLGARVVDEAVAAITACPQYAPTPLQSLGQLASELRLGAVWLKNESTRFGLQSFKALGGAYAVLVHVARRAGVTLSAFDPAGRKERSTASGMTFCAATDGNHGRAVAAGARLAGARCVIYVHEGVKESRRETLRALGAEVRVVSGDYDDAVRACAAEAADHDWIKVADTAGPGEDPSTPALVMQGYGVMVREALSQMEPQVPTHVFVQAGVGGLAAAVVAVVAEAGLAECRVVIVEPTKAACLLEAARRGGPVELAGDIETNMAMLSCGRVSEIAWRILEGRVHAYVAVDDADALAAARRLALAEGGGHAVLGISGAAGVAGLLAVREKESLSKVIGLDESSRVLLFGTEADIENDLGGSLQR